MARKLLALSGCGKRMILLNLSFLHLCSLCNLWLKPTAAVKLIKNGRRLGKIGCGKRIHAPDTSPKAKESSPLALDCHPGPVV